MRGERARALCCAVLACLILPLAAGIGTAEAAPAPGDGDALLTRLVTLSPGEAVTLPAGDLEEYCWYLDGTSVRLDGDGAVAAVAPGVSVVTAQSESETVIFTVRVEGSGSPEAPLRTGDAAEGGAEEDPGYCVLVNRLRDCVTVYRKDGDGYYTVPVRAMICSTGEDTPLGEYSVGGKADWLALFGDVYGQYATVIVGDILFHSVPYSLPSKDSLRWDYFNLLGTGCSMGCVRLQVEDALWIYENCPEGTPVVIYEDADPGPLGRPRAPVLNEGCGWDPTDPDPANPWRTGTPVLDAGGIRDAEPYTKPDLLDGVTALDSAGGNALWLVTAAGDVDTGRDGLYRVVYTFTDQAGRTAEATGWFRVAGA